MSNLSDSIYYTVKGFTKKLGVQLLPNERINGVALDFFRQPGKDLIMLVDPIQHKIEKGKCKYSFNFSIFIAGLVEISTNPWDVRSHRLDMQNGLSTNPPLEVYKHRLCYGNLGGPLLSTHFDNLKRDNILIQPFHNLILQAMGLVRQAVIDTEEKFK